MDPGRLYLSPSKKIRVVVDPLFIAIDVDEAHVSLRGAARSWVEPEEAERLAWTVPGLIDVENNIGVGGEPAAPE